MFYHKNILKLLVFFFLPKYKTFFLSKKNKKIIVYVLKKRQLNAFAQNWSDELGRRGGRTSTLHRPDNPYGENIFIASTTAEDAEWVLTAKDVVKAWLVVVVVVHPEREREKGNSLSLLYSSGCGANH